MGVRWDSVVDRGRFRLEAASTSREPAPASPKAVVNLEVLLFGGLSSVAAERSLNLQLQSPFSVGDAIAKIGQRLGGEFLRYVTEPSGAALRCCRVFVNGEPVNDIGTPIQCSPCSSKMEMILLTAAEGG